MDHIKATLESEKFLCDAYAKLWHDSWDESLPYRRLDRPREAERHRSAENDPQVLYRVEKQIKAGRRKRNELEGNIFRMISAQSFLTRTLDANRKVSDDAQLEEENEARAQTTGQVDVW